ncbi:uncharacterized protein LOC142004272 isoform X2 [Carettochelys insculpta]|uniref:uncharacterized protein LOC142004272 isoform X2 n=1 Tax=Carettochelys insculpta TaxID=44489 RepID=UPI003EB76C07
MNCWQIHSSLLCPISCVTRSTSFSLGVPRCSLLYKGHSPVCLSAPSCTMGTGLCASVLPPVQGAQPCVPQCSLLYNGYGTVCLSGPPICTMGTALCASVLPPVQWVWDCVPQWPPHLYNGHSTVCLSAPTCTMGPALPRKKTGLSAARGQPGWCWPGSRAPGTSGVAACVTSVPTSPRCKVLHARNRDCPSPETQEKESRWEAPQPVSAELTQSSQEATHPWAVLGPSAVPPARLGELLAVTQGRGLQPACYTHCRPEIRHTKEALCPPWLVSTAAAAKRDVSFVNITSRSRGKSAPQDGGELNLAACSHHESGSGREKGSAPADNSGDCGHKKSPGCYSGCV